MAQTPCKRVSEGVRLPHTFSADAAVGDVIEIGSIPAIVAAAVDFSEQPIGILDFGGCWDVPQVAGIITAGDAVYWDNDGSPYGGTASSGCATGTASGNYLMGLAAPTQPNGTTATAATDSYVRVKVTAAMRTATIAGSVTADDITGSDSTLAIVGLSAAQGGLVSLTGALSTTSGNAGGAASVVGGVGGATGAGGAVAITGGVSGATSGTGGGVTIAAGAAGSAAGNAAGGAAAFSGGLGKGTGAGGAIAITGGVSGSGATGNGGAIAAAGGAAASTDGAGGAVSLTGGAGAGTGAGGDASLVSGASGAGATGNGGAIAITSGAATSTNGTGGAITVTSGVGTGTGDGGAITIISGTSAAGGTTGAISVDTGAATGTGAGILIGDANATGVTIGAPLNFATGGGAADVQTVTLDPAATRYVAGMMIAWIPTADSTAACTVNVNGLGAKSIKTATGADPAAGDLEADGVALAIYDGTNFVLINPATTCD